MHVTQRVRIKMIVCEEDAIANNFWQLWEFPPITLLHLTTSFSLRSHCYCKGWRDQGTGSTEETTLFPGCDFCYAMMNALMNTWCTRGGGGGAISCANSSDTPSPLQYWQSDSQYQAINFTAQTQLTVDCVIILNKNTTRNSRFAGLNIWRSDVFITALFYDFQLGDVTNNFCHERIEIIAT